MNKKVKMLVVVKENNISLVQVFYTKIFVRWFILKPIDLTVNLHKHSHLEWGPPWVNNFRFDITFLINYQVHVHIIVLTKPFINNEKKKLYWFTISSIYAILLLVISFDPGSYQGFWHWLISKQSPHHKLLGKLW